MATILVIDDDRFSRVALRRLLEMDGHNVLEAETGLEGERLLASSRADIVFTDIFMPDQDGLQTIINIRKVDKAVPIVAVSSGGMTKELDYLKYSRRLGASYAMPKPFTDSAIREIVRNICA